MSLDSRVKEKFLGANSKRKEKIIMENDQELLTVAEVAWKLKVSARTVQRYIKENQLPAYRVKNRWKVSPTRLEAWLEKKNGTR